MNKKIYDAFFIQVRQALGVGQFNKEVIDALSADDWKELYLFAQKHDMVQVIGDVIVREKLAPAGQIADRFRKDTMQAAFRYEWLKKGLSDIREAFNKEKIPFIALKGVVIRDLYPQPWMRLSCDIDILVRKEDFSRTEEFCREKLGYKFDHKTAHDETLETDNGVHLELHHSLIEDDRVDKALNVLKGFWEDASPVSGGSEFVSSDEMFYFYHLAHMAKHFNGTGGCGVRPFIDLWLLNNKLPANPKRAELISRGGLEAFERTAISLGEYWLGLSEASDLVLRTEKFILPSCPYGNQANVQLVRQAKENNKIKYMFSRMFIPYEYLCAQYPSLEGRRWLTPLYEARRLTRLFKKGAFSRSAKEMVEVSRTSTSEVEGVKKLLDDLEL